jgi:hypothetical protein
VSRVDSLFEVTVDYILNIVKQIIFEMVQYSLVRTMTFTRQQRKNKGTYELLVFLYTCITNNCLKGKGQLEKVPSINIESHSL